ncbi:5-amino-6-(5-phosphoribosylamino)uracil reductase [Prochlorococcus marinus str. MIT 9201]|uniref:5-amino-6-(5-phosphoribosylamino)uracil reductase n=1 Tax=Prochlorococcus marinus str. MIT 9201 TaxID=93057 RepID=A0A0A2A1G2_PROMR|nr:dihydrofolate reductase family protein [Prochlorococcus marinus]KGF94676.1 5-amino-6-(5-phosphoribosylamino)uracil reductase [Prochlorococcus marinus str. MIT 9201]
MSIPKVTIVIASSLDGRIAFPEGGESHLGSEEDKKMLNQNLSIVDATIFGLGTLIAHQSTYLIKNLNNNEKVKISKTQPISIVASNSKKFNSNWKYFRQPIRRWLISSSKVDNLSNKDFERQLFFEDSWEKTLISLKKQGINDLALLGGAKLINSFIKEDLITDIKITIIPQIIGGRYTWIPPEQTNEIFNLKRLWEIKSIENLMNNEIHVHYKKI